MTIEYHFFEDADEDNRLGIKFIADELSDVYELKRLGLRIKRPVKTFGNITEGQAYLWINIPTAKSDPPHKDDFGNDKT